MLTDAQFVFISKYPFVYLTHPVPLIIPDGTTVHVNSNIIIAHTKEVRLFRKVAGVEQTPVQQIVTTVKEAYLVDIRSHMKNDINETVADILTHIQYNYVQLMTHELLERKDIIKKTTYHPQNPIATVFYPVK